MLFPISSAFPPLGPQSSAQQTLLVPHLTVNQNSCHCGPYNSLRSALGLATYQQAHEGTAPLHSPLGLQKLFQEAFPRPVLPPWYTCHQTCSTGEHENLPLSPVLTRMPIYRYRDLGGSFLTAVFLVPKAVPGILPMLCEYWLSQVTSSAWGRHTCEWAAHPPCGCRQYLAS